MKRTLALALFTSAVIGAATAHADGEGYDPDFLAGSTLALAVGPTGFGDVSQYPGYIPSLNDLYLTPNGFTGTTEALVTPDSFDYGPSVAQGEAAVIATVETDYDNGLFGDGDPLTLTGYSQGASDISGVEQALYDYGIPENDINILLIGDTSDPYTGFIANFVDSPTIAPILESWGWGDLVNLLTPNDLYPTEDYMIPGDEYADYTANNWLGGLLHFGYLGETPTAIADATPITEGLTTYFTLPDVSDAWQLVSEAFNNVYF